MSKRGENIHKRKDGRWEARIKRANYDNTSTGYISIYGKTYREVKEKKTNIFCHKILKIQFRKKLYQIFLFFG